MIRVERVVEYPSFNIDVREPGAVFLAVCPTPNSDQFKKKNYWTRAAPELHAVYKGICAYTAMYMPQQGTVDHFLPKSIHPQLAYEWNNFRLAGGKVNNSKGDLTNVLDPFEIQDDWFCLEIPSCLLMPNPGLTKELRVQIKSSINSLRLNQDDSYVQERCNILMEYAREAVTLEFLQRRYPFLAKELVRQGVNQPALREKFKIQP